MMRRTTFWEDLGIGVLAGAIIVLTPFTWALTDSLWKDSMPRFVSGAGPSVTPAPPRR